MKQRLQLETTVALQRKLFPERIVDGYGPPAHRTKIDTLASGRVVGSGIERDASMFASTLREIATRQI